jgi:hypothetical protein
VGRTFAVVLREPRFPDLVSFSPSGRAGWPAAVLATDEAVAALHFRLSAAVIAHYLSLGRVLAQSAQVYVLLVQHLAQLRGAKAPAVCAGAFRDDLDRSRWSVRQVLKG